MTFIETGRKVAGVGEWALQVIRRFDRNLQSYGDVADHFLAEARIEWYKELWKMANPHPHTLRPYEVVFSPLRLNIPDVTPTEVQNMVTGQLFGAIKRKLPPEDEGDCYSYTILHPRSASLVTLSYYSGMERQVNVPFGDDIVEKVTGKPGRFGVGILEDGIRPQIVLLPPGYSPWNGYNRIQASMAGDINFNPKGEFPKPVGEVTSVEAGDVGGLLTRDFNPKRLFKKMVVGEEAYWEAVPV